MPISAALGRRVENQIAALTTVGLIKPPSATRAGPLPRKVAPADASHPLESRARAYLDINCAHCHRLGGVGGRAAFQLVESLPLERAGLINGQPLVPLLGPESRIVAPGAPERSEIFHRIGLTSGGRMPLLGSERVDAEGVELIRQWIAQMK